MKKGLDLIPIEIIENKIYLIRGVKVMLDKDLAKLYGVETRILNQAVKRNLDRFPSDFVFQLTSKELDNLRSQIVIANLPSHQNHMQRFLPYAFTENGVAMLSSVLKSKQAIQVNISIIRIFTKLRSFLFLEQELRTQITELESNTSKVFRVVFQRLDVLEDESYRNLVNKKLDT